MANKTILSIDFDFFVREKLEWDWGHRESPLFIETIWPIRASTMLAKGLDFAAEAGIIGKPSELISDLENQKWKFRKDFKLSIAESHSSAYYSLKGKKNLEIINIDAHHDISYGQTDSLSCGNWIYRLALEGSVKKVTIVYPEWRKEQNFDYPSDEVLSDLRNLGVEVDIVYGIQSVEPKTVSEVFIARSGAWVPPWTDNEFMDFISTWIFKANNCFIYTYESLEQFRRKFNLEEVKKCADETKKHLEEMKELHPGKIFI